MNRLILICSFLTTIIFIGPACNGENYASFKGGQISQKEVDKYSEPRIKRLQGQINEVKRQAGSELLFKKLLELEAKGKGIQRFFADYMNIKKNNIPDDLAQKYVLINNPSLGTSPKGLMSAKSKILNDKLSIYRNLLFLELAEKYEVKYTSKTEIASKPRKKVDITGLPFRGPKNAPITIVKYTDFQCPYCKRGYNVLKEIFNKYKGKIKWVYADFPLNFHKQAINAAKALRCAGDQNKFWEFHDTLFLKDRITEANDLLQIAAILKLDVKSLKKCMDSKKYAQEIQKTSNNGKKLGVTGTPAFFINGRFVSGAIPFTEFVEYIKAEGIK